MPRYYYFCSKCENKKEVNMSISEFLKYKKEEHYCEDCHSLLFQKVFPTYSKIDRDKEYIIQSAKEEAKQIVEKINKGDERTIVEMCGDKPRGY